MRTSNKTFPGITEQDVTNGTAERSERDYVMALEKGLAIIEAFGQLRGAATLTQLAEVTGHTKASVRRSLHTLCHLGYATQDGRQFQLAARALRLGSAFVVSDALTRLAQPILETTAERTKESASIAVLDSQDSVFVARATHRRSLSVGLGVGARLPAYASATGRVLLGGQPRDWVRFMLNRMGRPALTVPILDRRGRTIAAMSLSVATSRMDVPTILEKLLPELERAKQKFPALL